MANILVIHGPNLNLLGIREPEIYGRTTLEEINTGINNIARQYGAEAICFQSNSEGEIINIIHRESKNVECIILNPGAYTHYSIAIADAIKAVNVPAIEVHLSNIFGREEFRQRSVIAPAVVGQISGFGSFSYQLAVYAALNIIKERENK
ncbi:MAG: type II 3-dehydroquinate dehydratase [Desulfitobacteriaceae bacterium]|nr:type II 3-dehydroquinate dehydratase [Desulfitobacteriaceae bacterium]MDD4752329.1 type II 3-dehydroquinate dehydratase [Desulfitobacteriaceae bacterium]